MSTDAFRAEVNEYAAPLGALLLSFADALTPPDVFEEQFFSVFAQLPGLPSKAVAAELNRLFFAVEDFVSDGVDLEGNEYSDPEELRSRIRQFLRTAGFTDPGA